VNNRLYVANVGMYKFVFKLSPLESCSNITKCTSLEKPT